VVDFTSLFDRLFSIFQVVLASWKVHADHQASICKVHALWEQKPFEKRLKILKFLK